MSRLEEALEAIPGVSSVASSTSPLLALKGFLYNATLHVPLIVKLPGQTQGARLTANAEEVDLLPTILDLVGMQTPQWVEGLTLRPALEQGRCPRTASGAATARGFRFA